jgi:hypothetical protein
VVIDIETEVLSVHVESRGVVIHPGPTGALGGLVAGIVNIGMDKQGVGQARFSLNLKNGRTLNFRAAPDDARTFFHLMRKWLPSH